MQYDPNSIWAVDPKQYCKRFRDFIYKAFMIEFLKRRCLGIG
jgi:1-phosphatidylinositol-4-phosphate 5-kinase